jgi:hypothetical protein
MQLAMYVAHSIFGTLPYQLSNCKCRGAPIVRVTSISMRSTPAKTSHDPSSIK